MGDGPDDFSRSESLGKEHSGNTRAIEARSFSAACEKSIPRGSWWQKSLSLRLIRLAGLFAGWTSFPCLRGAEVTIPWATMPSGQPALKEISGTISTIVSAVPYGTVPSPAQ